MVVYAYKDDNNKIVYVGQTKDLHNRHLAHIRDNITLFDKSFTHKDKYIIEILHICINPIESRYFEKFYIRYYKPTYNIYFNNNKKDRQ